MKAIIMLASTRSQKTKAIIKANTSTWTTRQKSHLFFFSKNSRSRKKERKKMVFFTSQFSKLYVCLFLKTNVFFLQTNYILCSWIVLICDTKNKYKIIKSYSDVFSCEKVKSNSNTNYRSIIIAKSRNHVRYEAWKLRENMCIQHETL